MGDEGEVPLIQVTNVSPQTTNQQMRELFSYLGRIKELKVYPESNGLRNVSSACTCGLVFDRAHARLIARV
jgi:hypothetical protein